MECPSRENRRNVKNGIEDISAFAENKIKPLSTNALCTGSIKWEVILSNEVLNSFSYPCYSSSSSCLPL